MKHLNHCKAGRADICLAHCIRKTIKTITTLAPWQSKMNG
jgi:hypothetical protein